MSNPARLLLLLLPALLAAVDVDLPSARRGAGLALPAGEGRRAFNDLFRTDTDPDLAAAVLRQQLSAELLPTAQAARLLARPDEMATRVLPARRARLAILRDLRLHPHDAAPALRQLAAESSGDDEVVLAAVLGALLHDGPDGVVLAERLANPRHAQVLALNDPGYRRRGLRALVHMVGTADPASQRALTATLVGASPAGVTTALELLPPGSDAAPAAGALARLMDGFEGSPGRDHERWNAILVALHRVRLDADDPLGRRLLARAESDPLWAAAVATAIARDRLRLTDHEWRRIAAMNPADGPAATALSAVMTVR